MLKLDGQALYDGFEVDRVVKVAMKGRRARPCELDAATTPVASRLLMAHAHAAKALAAAGDDPGQARQAQAAKDEMAALTLFKSDIATYVRVYGFLSQIVDYGNTEVEKRAIFFRPLHPLLNFGREREGLDLSALKLTAYTIKQMDDAALNLAAGEPEKIYAAGDAGSGAVQDKAMIALAELIAKVNDLFEGDLTPGDKLVYVNDVIRGRLMASALLAEQAANNTKAQLANSPDLANEIMNAVMDALTAHQVMSRQALASDELRADMKDVLLGAGRLWEGLRARSMGDVGTAGARPGA